MLTVRLLVFPGFLLNTLRDGVQLYVGRTFIDGSNLAVAVELFLRVVLGEPHSAHPLHAFRGGEGRYLAGVVLGHRSFFDEGEVVLFQASRVVDQQTSSFDLRGSVRHLVLQALELPYSPAELLSLHDVRQCGVEASLS